ncbi:MAG TPA: hypothetical protein VII92_08120 [Anaerolineae bacterium]
MKITVISTQDVGVVVETMEVNPQYPSELASILRDCHVIQVSDSAANEAVMHGALDLRP